MATDCLSYAIFYDMNVSLLLWCCFQFEPEIRKCMQLLMQYRHEFIMNCLLFQLSVPQVVEQSSIDYFMPSFHSVCF